MAIRVGWSVRERGGRLGTPAALTLAFVLGLLAGGGVLHRAVAGPPAALPKDLPAAPASDKDRWVAVIYGTEPITREEFADYLIARHADKLELLVNKRIIEHACHERGIEVTPSEIEAALGEDLRDLKVNLETFESKVLKQYRKSLLEWKEDVIRPRLAMTKLCRDRVQATDKDFHDAFEAYFGEKVVCRLILWPKGEEKIAMNAYAELRKSDADFDRLAKQQASPTLAATGGQIEPFGHHTTGNEELEKEAFSLQPGEISRIIGTPQGSAVLKCVRHIPPDTSKKLETERARLEKEIIDRQIKAEMPRVFKELQDKAQAKLFLKHTTTQEELERAVKHELQAEPAQPGRKPPPGH